MPAALLIPTLIGAGAGLGGAAIAAHGATSAAETQVNAAKDARAQSRADLAPYMATGEQATNALRDLTAPGSDFLKGFQGQFTAPTDVTEQNDPGYQFRIKQAQQGFERSAAARGQLLSGGTLKALQRYTQDYASNEYGNVYGRALGEFQQKRNIFETNASNQFGRLTSLANSGQAAATGNAQMGADLTTGAANAQAAGQVGSANAYGGALSGIGNNLSFLSMLQAMNKSQPTAAPIWATQGQGNQFNPRAMQMNPWNPTGLPS